MIGQFTYCLRLTILCFCTYHGFLTLLLLTFYLLDYDRLIRLLFKFYCLSFSVCPKHRSTIDVVSLKP